MRRPGDPLRHRLAARLLAGTAAVLRRLPTPLAYAVADAGSLFVVAFALAHELRVARQGRGMLRNLRIAFRDELTPRRALRLAWGWARHVSRLAVEFCRMPGIDASNVGAHVDTTDLQKLVPLIDAGGGLICVSGHVGAWEMVGHAPRLRGIPVTIVVRPISSRPLDAWVNRVRCSGGLRVVSKHGVLLSLKRALERGEVVGFLADEDAPRKPVFAPFLGTLAATSPAAAFLHRTTGAPIAVVSCHRVGRERFRFHVWDLIQRAPGAAAAAEPEAVMRRVNDALSRAILAYPSQWLWGSRRFRTRPPGERPGADGLPPRAAPELLRADPAA